MFRFLIHFCYHKGYLLLLNWQIIVYPTDVPKYPAGAFVRTIGSQTSYYTFHGTAATWYDAVETCKRENIHSNLATVVDPAEQNYLVKLIQSDVSKYYLKSVFFSFFFHSNTYFIGVKYTLLMPISKLCISFWLTCIRFNRTNDF